MVPHHRAFFFLNVGPRGACAPLLLWRSTYTLLHKLYYIHFTTLYYTLLHFTTYTLLHTLYYTLLHKLYYIHFTTLYYTLLHFTTYALLHTLYYTLLHKLYYIHFTTHTSRNLCSSIALVFSLSVALSVIIFSLLSVSYFFYFFIF